VLALRDRAEVLVLQQWLELSNQAVNMNIRFTAGLPLLQGVETLTKPKLKALVRSDMC
jgi:hypothetical protein